ncbi:MAG: dihydrofolate reductase family protein [Acidimicrobiia bacterium]
MARKLILMSGVSLDGFIEGPNREIDWHMVDEELHQHFNDEIATMGALLGGRVTHELMAAFWPTADENPSNPPTMIEFARIWREMPKFVYSRTLKQADWKTTIVREVVPAEVEELKAQPGGDPLLGGSDLAVSFMEHDLIDEFRIYVHPVLIGRGKPLFSRPDTMLVLRLAETRAFGNGVVLLRYLRH